MDPLQQLVVLNQVFGQAMSPLNRYNEGRLQMAQRTSDQNRADNLRYWQRQQEIEDMESTNKARENLVKLQIQGQRDAAIASTERAIQLQSAKDRENAERQRADDVRTQYSAYIKMAARLGKEAKPLAAFGKTSEEQLNNLGVESAKVGAALESKDDEEANIIADALVRRTKELQGRLSQLAKPTTEDIQMAEQAGLEGLSKESISIIEKAKEKGISLDNALARLPAQEQNSFAKGVQEYLTGIQLYKQEKNPEFTSTLRELQDVQSKTLALANVRPKVLGKVYGVGSELNKAAQSVSIDTQESVSPGKVTVDDVIKVKTTPAAGTKPVVPIEANVGTANAAPAEEKVQKFEPYSPVSVDDGINSQRDRTRRNEAVRDFLVSGAQSVKNVLTPSNWNERGRYLVYEPREELIYDQLMGRLNDMTVRDSPRATSLRNRLYELTSPAAYINSRPRY